MTNSANGSVDLEVMVRGLPGVGTNTSVSGQYCSHFFYTAHIVSFYNITGKVTYLNALIVTPSVS